MDRKRTGDTDQVDIELAQGAMNTDANDQCLAQEALPPPSYDASEPLLATSAADGEDGEPSRQPATASSKEEPPFLPVWLAVIFVVLTIGPFVAPIGLMVFLSTSGRDPLGFSFLAYLMAFALLISVVLVTVTAMIISKVALAKDNKLGIAPLSEKLKPILGWMIFTWGFFITYLLFYGTCWIWAGSKVIDDLMVTQATLLEFEAKVSVPNVLSLLTRCLHNSLPDRNATVEDFSTCLTALGVPATGG